MILSINDVACPYDILLWWIQLEICLKCYYFLSKLLKLTNDVKDIASGVNLYIVSQHCVRILFVNWQQTFVLPLYCLLTEAAKRKLLRIKKEHFPRDVFMCLIAAV